MTQPLLKYPRTPHLEGSRLQPGDDDLDRLSFSTLVGVSVVVEEKVDGANVGISFSADAKLLLQSRGHYLMGGAREAQFALLKQWAYTHASSLWQGLGDRYLLYGEWLYAKHTIFYNHLPHYFLAFDILDRHTNLFLDRQARLEILAGLPICTVPLLFQGKLKQRRELTNLTQTSNYINSIDYLAMLQQLCDQLQINFENCLTATDTTGLMEGIYIKVEAEGHVVERLKYVRPSFRSTLDQSGAHWSDRPMIPNQLRPGVDIFAPTLSLQP